MKPTIASEDEQTFNLAENVSDKFENEVMKWARNARNPSEQYIDDQSIPSSQPIETKNVRGIETRPVTRGGRRAFKNPLDKSSKKRRSNKSQVANKNQFNEGSGFKVKDFNGYDAVLIRHPTPVQLLDALSMLLWRHSTKPSS
ncbi:hypothetical protein ACLOJK_010563 [Asimina triloba]